MYSRKEVLSETWFCSFFFSKKDFKKFYSWHHPIFQGKQAWVMVFFLASINSAKEHFHSYLTNKTTRSHLPPKWYWKVGEECARFSCRVVCINYAERWHGDARAQTLSPVRGADIAPEQRVAACRARTVGQCHLCSLLPQDLEANSAPLGQRPALTWDERPPAQEICCDQPTLLLPSPLLILSRHRLAEPRLFCQQLHFHPRFAGHLVSDDFLQSLLPLSFDFDHCPVEVEVQPEVEVQLEVEVQPKVEVQPEVEVQRKVGAQPTVAGAQLEVEAVVDV